MLYNCIPIRQNRMGNYILFNLGFKIGLELVQNLGHCSFKWKNYKKKEKNRPPKWFEIGSKNLSLSNKGMTKT